ncbi:hypothetical protein ACS5PU_16870 [Pedobacter sp. GSP4]|uniref:hypothetical protein n=1 Tax=Pedobacter sp. GSP4 TaxID=3453716 RepID=UPI003EEAB54E
MEELIVQLKAFLRRRIGRIEIKGAAEINLVLAENENPVTRSAELKAHVIEIIDESTLAKINLLSSSGGVLDSFSLNQ